MVWYSDSVPVRDPSASQLVITIPDLDPHFICVGNANLRWCKLGIFFVKLNKSRAI